MIGRRAFLHAGLGSVVAGPLFAALKNRRWQAAEDVLEKATKSKQVSAATLFVKQGQDETAGAFGSADSPDAMFLLGSISKPISVSGLMTLYDEGKFRLDNPAAKFLPEFKGEGREKITIRQLLTHVSGLPDQLPENAMLRKSHAPLSEFVERAVKTPLLFPTGSKYSYSSMGILLATEIAQRIVKQDFLKFLDEAVFRPLEMKHSAIGLGRFELKDLVPAQVEKAAVESGAGDPAAREWDWNSPYWRKLGAPWGSVHASAPDIGKFLNAFLHPEGKMLSAETARLMVKNHNPEGFTARGLGFGFQSQAGCPKGSPRTFGHTGSTGTLAWADPLADTICVVLTTLPGRAVSPHPRQLVSEKVRDASS